MITFFYCGSFQITVITLLKKINKEIGIWSPTDVTKQAILTNFSLFGLHLGVEIIKFCGQVQFVQIVQLQRKRKNILKHQFFNQQFFFHMFQCTYHLPHCTTHFCLQVFKIANNQIHNTWLILDKKLSQFVKQFPILK